MVDKFLLFIAVVAAGMSAFLAINSIGDGFFWYWIALNIFSVISALLYANNVYNGDK